MVHIILTIHQKGAQEGTQTLAATNLVQITHIILTTTTETLGDETNMINMNLMVKL